MGLGQRNKFGMNTTYARPRAHRALGRVATDRVPGPEPEIGEVLDLDDDTWVFDQTYALRPSCSPRTPGNVACRPGHLPIVPWACRPMLLEGDNRSQIREKLLWRARTEPDAVFQTPYRVLQLKTQAMDIPNGI